jgi:hypothetical protein
VRYFIVGRAGRPLPSPVGTEGLAVRRIRGAKHIRKESGGWGRTSVISLPLDQAPTQFAASCARVSIHSEAWVEVESWFLAQQNLHTIESPSNTARALRRCHFGERKHIWKAHRLIFKAPSSSAAAASVSHQIAGYTCIRITYEQRKRCEFLFANESTAAQTVDRTAVSCFFCYHPDRWAGTRQRTRRQATRRRLWSAAWRL